MLELVGRACRKNLPEGAHAPGEDQPHRCSVDHCQQCGSPPGKGQDSPKGEADRWRRSGREKAPRALPESLSSGLGCTTY